MGPEERTIQRLHKAGRGESQAIVCGGEAGNAR